MGDLALRQLRIKSMIPMGSEHMFLPKLKKHQKKEGPETCRIEQILIQNEAKVQRGKTMEKPKSLKEETLPKDSYTIATLQEEPEASAESNAARASRRKMLLGSL